METRYYIADKQSWSDVTISVNRKNTPKKGDVINVGKIKMTVKDVVDGTIHGKPVTKVMLESTGLPFTQIDEVIEQLDNPIFLVIDEPVNEASIRKGGSSDNRTRVSTDAWTTTQLATMRAYGPGSAGTFGGYIRSGLSGMGVGYGVQVTDFGEAVTVTVTYSNAQTGKMAGQSFVIVYHGKETYGIKNQYVYSVYSSSARYRRCNDYNQCISYIRSKVSSLPGATSGAA